MTLIFVFNFDVMQVSLGLHKLENLLPIQCFYFPEMLLFTAPEMECRIKKPVISD